MNLELTPQAIEQIKEASKSGSEQGIKDALLLFGFDTNNPIEVQKDLAFLTKQRKATEKVTFTVKATLIGVLISSTLGIIFIGLKEALK